ncbi:MAG: response regulator [Methanobacterium sp.]
MSAKNVLVVEDENIVALDIKNKLEDLGFNVPYLISSGEEAVEKAFENQPDLIMMDIILKGKINGLEAAQKILETLNIPIIFLTANTNKKILESTRRIKYYNYIPKPFNKKVLETVIKESFKKTEN